MSGLPGAEEARYTKTVTCPTCGYAMNAAVEATSGPEADALPHGPEVPVGSYLLCLACGALCQVDPDGDMTPLGVEQFRQAISGEEGQALISAILSRTMLMSTDQGAAEHPFRRLGWRETDQPPAPAPGNMLVDDAPGGPELGSLWAWVAVDSMGGEGIAGSTAMLGPGSTPLPLVTGKERLAKAGFRRTIEAVVKLKTGRRFQLRRYALAETVEELGP